MSERDPIELVNVDLLPPNLRLLCRVLGSKVAFELCKQRGGVPLRVPSRPTPEHWLVELVGFAGLKQLVDAIGGEYFDVPKFDKVMIQLQHQQVHACLKLGMGLTRTALETGYTKRHVLNIQADLAEAMGVRYSAPHDEQLDMFGTDSAAEVVHAIDDRHREAALSATNGAHDPFGLRKPSA